MPSRECVVIMRAGVEPLPYKFDLPRRETVGANCVRPRVDVGIDPYGFYPTFVRGFARGRSRTPAPTDSIPLWCDGVGGGVLDAP